MMTPPYDNSDDYIEDANDTDIETKSYLEDGNIKSYVVIDSIVSNTLIDIEIVFNDIVLSDNFLYTGVIIYFHNLFYPIVNIFLSLVD